MKLPRALSIFVGAGIRLHLDNTSWVNIASRRLEAFNKHHWSHVFFLIESDICYSRYLFIDKNKTLKGFIEVSYNNYSVCSSERS